MSCRLHRGDCLDVMRTLRSESIDTVIVDPPFGTTELAWDAAPALADWWAEAHRVTKETSPIVVFASGKFVPELLESNRRYYRYDLIWQKRCPTGVPRLQSSHASLAREHPDLLPAVSRQHLQPAKD